MAVSDHRKSHSDFKVFQLCLFWQSRNASPSSPSSAANNLHLSNEGSRSDRHQEGHSRKSSSFKTVSSAARSLLPSRRRLRLDPSKYLYFPYVPGKQVRTAVRLKNTSKSRVAFKFQTTAPKSCYMRPPGGILEPGESLIAIVFKFVEQPEINEKIMDLKNKVKFKIISLKVKDGVDYVPELFDEQRDQVTVERILRAVFRDPERPCPALEKTKRQLAEADAAVEARESRKKPPAETSPRFGGEGLVIDEWKIRRERYLARQVEAAAEST
ncbi:vesicle-associated protein 4-1-like [Prosopis cineraria]|uniref:vesicle-associated protein 4-1-like n=1 Tax=Prosopis cineraria TaxID=364024 RepID=UPI00240F748B|nr:vesicle-associated protein 4-1-like [Prosopis cineraria]